MQQYLKWDQLKTISIKMQLCLFFDFWFSFNYIKTFHFSMNRKYVSFLLIYISSNTFFFYVSCSINNQCCRQTKSLVITNNFRNQNETKELKWSFQIRILEIKKKKKQKYVENKNFNKQTTMMANLQSNTVLNKGKILYAKSTHDRQLQRNVFCK